MRNIRLSLSCLLLAACSNGLPQMMGPGTTGPTGDPLAAGVKIAEVSIYQGPKSVLMKAGASVVRDVPVIAGRDALVRIFLSVDKTWTAREVKLVLNMTSGGVALPAREKTWKLPGTSTEADYQSTVNFELPGDQVTSDLTWAVAIYETGARPANAPEPDQARFPEEGELALDARDAGESLKIVAIPVRYDADGSGRLPDTSATQIERLRAQMHALYPVKKVEITVAEEFPWATAVNANGTGWDTLLNAIVRKRQKDAVESNVYYYGLFAPASSLGEYCGRGCVLGLSPLAYDPNDEFVRGSIGLGYGGQRSDAAGTFVHEIGHAHGREHAPCGLYGQSADPDYPHSGARLGVWAYDIVGKTMIDPGGRNRDMMSYCNPIFVSDYSYKALFERISHVNATQQLYIPGPDAQLEWRSVVVDGNGNAVSGGGEPITLRRPPGGQVRTVDHVKNGQTERVGVRYYPFDHLPGGIMLVPSDYTGALRNLR
jgi:hypothetical protein